MRIPALLLSLAFAAPAAACPFCSAQGQTLTGELNQADFILVGNLKNAKRDPSDFTKGTTDLHITTVVKPHPYLDGKTCLTLPRFVDAAAGDSRFLVFCGIYPNTPHQAAAGAVGAVALADFRAYQLDPYRGEPLKADSKMAEYLKGAVEVREKDAVSKLRYFFPYLDSADLVIGADAYMEFGNADYKDVRALAETVSPDTLVKWLKDPQTPASRFGLYGLMLGHCGKESHAAALKAILDDPTKQYSSGLDGLLAGYVLLDPKGGWEYLSALLADTKREFPVRYAGLKVLRFFWEYRPDVVKPDQVLAGMKALVQQDDIADLPIEDLRKWGRTELTGFVIEIGRREGHAAVPIVRRAVLRFALVAADKEKVAAEYVAQARKDDPERVKLVEEMLKDEPNRPVSPKGTGDSN